MKYFSSGILVLIVLFFASCSAGKLAFNNSDRDQVSYSDGSDAYHEKIQVDYGEPTPEEAIKSNNPESLRKGKNTKTRVKSSKNKNQKGKVVKNAKNSLGDFAQNTLMNRLRIKPGKSGTASANDTNASLLGILLIIALILLILILLEALGISLLNLILIGLLIFALVILILWLMGEL